MLTWDVGSAFAGLGGGSPARLDGDKRLKILDRPIPNLAAADADSLVLLLLMIIINMVLYVICCCDNPIAKLEIVRENIMWLFNATTYCNELVVCNELCTEMQPVRYVCKLDSILILAPSNLILAPFI